MSKHFERWKELAARCLPEQDPAKLMELANEMNLVLTQRTRPNYPQCHEDRKAQKLLDRIDKKLQKKGTTLNSLPAASPKQRPSAA